MLCNTYHFQQKISNIPTYPHIPITSEDRKRWKTDTVGWYDFFHILCGHRVCRPAMSFSCRRFQEHIRDDHLFLSTMKFLNGWTRGRPRPTKGLSGKIAFRFNKVFPVLSFEYFTRYIVKIFLYATGIFRILSLFAPSPPCKGRILFFPWHVNMWVSIAHRFPFFWIYYINVT